ncbi:MAG: glycosyltransferase family 2 protein [Flavobacteriales bacterium]|nr:glycosyltransferase family 2 protein [Flavobacteriales bacterium]
MEKPLVSIIMAAKDTAPYLRECLDSIIAQTYSNWELIAVNDHSSDATPDILQEYANKDQRIQVVHSKRSLLIPALKEGYAFAAGELINRMDSDDRMPHDKIEVLVREWLKVGKGHIIAGGTEHFVDEGEVGGGFLRYEQWLNRIAREQLHWQEIYRECVIPSHCWIIHRDDFEASDGFNPEVYPEDYDLCFRFYRQKLRVIGIDKVLHHWRDRSERISRTWDEYQDNRYYAMKLRYFFELDRDDNRPLVLWGAGRNGKDLAKLMLAQERHFHWVCDNPKKIGLDVYDVRMHDFSSILDLESPQIVVAVASPQGQDEILDWFEKADKRPGVDYWFF